MDRFPDLYLVNYLFPYYYKFTDTAKAHTSKQCSSVLEL